MQVLDSQRFHLRGTKVQNPATPLEPGACRHHWKIASPRPEDQGVQKGKCKKCKEKRDFRPYEAEDKARMYPSSRNKKKV